MEPAHGPVTTIDVGKLVWPYRWIKWTNAAIVSIVVVLPTSIVSSLLQGDTKTAAGVAILLALFVFPGWVAWQNINVVHSVKQRYTIRTLTLFGITAILAGGLGLAGGMNATNEREQVTAIVYGGVFFVAGFIPLMAAHAVAKLRRQTVDVLNIRLSALVANLEVPAEETHPRQIKAQRPVLGWTLVGVAVAIWMATNFIPKEWVSVSLEARLTSNLSQFAFVLVLLARACFQPTATTLLAGDHRPPVLLLRSFIDDERIDWQQSNQSFVDSSLESRLTSHFARFGPFIAVGTPKEGIPVIGAARAQLGDAEWQAQVIAWVLQSRFILMMAGISDWVDWELKQVIACAGVDRLIVCFPPIGKRRWQDKTLRKFDANMQARLVRLRGAFAGTPWAEGLAQLNEASTLRSLIFGADGQITVVRAKSRDRNAYHLGVLIAHWVMLRGLTATAGAVFDAPPDAPQSRGELRAMWGLSMSLALAATAMLAWGMASDWAASCVPIGLAGLLAALLANPAAGRRLATLRHPAFLQRAAVTAALLLAVHGALVFALTAAGEVLDGQPGSGAASLAFTAMRYPAHAGLIEAQHNLGVFYLNGKGVAQSDKMACEWVRRSAHAGYAASERMYGVCLIEEMAQPGPGESGVAYLQRAADRGDLVAISWLGDAYFQGKGVQKDVARAIPYYEAAASGGNVIASRILGEIYLGGKDVPVQYDKARRAFEMADERGDAKATYQLGFMALQGHGVAKDARVAGKYFERSARAGFHGAELVLGLMLKEGEGMPRDINRARMLLTAARASDDPQIKAMAEEHLQGMGQ